MSDPSSVDLSDLNFMPDWLKQPGGQPNAPREEYRDRPAGRQGGQGGNRGKGGRGGGGPRRDDRGGDNRGGGNRGGGRRDDFQGRGTGGGGDRRGGGGGRGGRNSRDGRGGGYERRPAPAAPPKGISAKLQPAATAVHQIAEQIKKTARAYPVFDVARLMLAGRDRYSIVFKRDGDSAPELFSCNADGSAWLSRSEAIAHLPHSAAFAEHYSEEVIEGDPPKGNYTSIAVCGMSGVLIGPPNHHSYQTEIARLHRERFGNMSLDRFKSRIRVERDEEIIDKWKAEQSIQRHFTYKLAPEGEEAPKFESREAAGKHFIEKHAEALIAPATEVTVSGDIAGKNLSPGLFTLLREVSENTHRHPATLVQPLCGMLGSEGLKFFKRGRKIFAALTRPKPLNDNTGLSAPILAIVEFLRANKRANVETLLGALAPTPAAAAPTEAPPKEEASPAPAAAEEPSAKIEPAPATDASPETEAAPEATAEPVSEAPSEGDSPAEEASKSTQAEPKPEAKPEDEAKTELTTEQIKILQDLRWLLHEGAAIAFGDGHIELATPKAPRPDQPPKSKKSAKKAPRKDRGTPAAPKAKAAPAAPTPAATTPAATTPAATKPETAQPASDASKAETPAPPAEEAPAAVEEEKPKAEPTPPVPSEEVPPAPTATDQAE